MMESLPPQIKFPSLPRKYVVPEGDLTVYCVSVLFHCETNDSVDLMAISFIEPGLNTIEEEEVVRRGIDLLIDERNATGKRSAKVITWCSRVVTIPRGE